MMNGKDFYPTPASLVDKMLLGIKIEQISTILEPSAGKGDIVDGIREKMELHKWEYRGSEKTDIDTVEIDPNLQHILKGKGYKVVHHDFLSLQTFKKYDLVIMNPPFCDGDKHLLKAIQLQQDGGKIICLLNAETIKNPYTNARKDLVRKLDELNASIEYIEGAFTDAERQTDVEIALIKLDIPEKAKISNIIANLKQEEHYQEPQYVGHQIMSSDFLESIVEQYNFEVKAGLKLIDEYHAIKPYIVQSFKESSYRKDDPIIKLELCNDKHATTSKQMINSYIKQVRYKYWENLFASDMFNQLFTSNLQQEYHEKITELRDYDFSLFNIKQIHAEIIRSMSKGIEETILDLFDEFSHKHHWLNETSKNIHYYSGWATNKCWKINKKVIIPMYNVFSTWSGKFQCSDYNVAKKLRDIEKVFNYLDNGQTAEISLSNVLRCAENCGQTRKIDTKYFLITFYKKGTCHLEFKNMELLKKFNIFGSQRKGWLPPSYGKAHYQDMSTEEQTIIDEFEGREAYEKVLNQKDYYIFQTAQPLLLAS